MTRTGSALTAFADELDAVRARMDRAREVAAAAGIQFTAEGIVAPAVATPAWDEVLGTIDGARHLESRAHAALSRQLDEQDVDLASVTSGSFVTVASASGPAGEPGPEVYAVGGPKDFVAWTRWGAMLRGASVVRPDLDDSLRLYAHYRAGSGDPVTVDYEEGYREDSGIRDVVHDEIATARAAAERIHQETGQTSFSITGGATSAGTYPVEENWQKTLGGHTVWGSGDVMVEGDRATMTVTVHAEDRYNFNRGESDIATGEPDDENGRFAELGWARSFDVQGELTRTVSWDLHSDESPSIVGGTPKRDPGGEDRLDGTGGSR